MDGQIELPFGTSSGWAGTDTSKERAEQQDTDGTYTRRQGDVLTMLDELGTYGATWQEVSSTLDVHHGQASGVLSGLHKTGHIARLSQRRGRCKIYVLPKYVLGCHTEPYGVTRKTDTSRDQIVSWLSSQSVSVENNIVEQQWAAYFRRRIENYDYLETSHE